MLQINSIKTSFILLSALLLISCKQANTQSITKSNTAIIVPEFNADSAYRYTAEQVAFGPRVPNTKAHQECGNYFTETFRRFGADVTEQNATLYTYKRYAIQAKNIIASFNADSKNRILLCAHWDTRPFADHDADPANYLTAIDGANDGAGACGILLEIARLIGQQLPPDKGIDIIFFDAEDWGTPEFEQAQYGSTGWCLGSEYWAKNPHTPNYTAQFGILLDMASAENARFHKEYFSQQYAKHIVDKVWNAALTLGYDNFFINQPGVPIEDDHRKIFHYRHIPCIDIIQYKPDSPSGCFGDYWHTVDDNMQTVSRETMKAVGQTLLYTLYKL